MNRHRALIEVLLEKFRENTISREEFEQLAAIVNDPASEGEIKYWMEEHWDDMDLSSERSPFEDSEAENQFEELQKKIRQKGGEN
ncbi:hypothetical protein LS482_05560 [Sinomicrobium kalidii]|uniref:hypothetical protein n=1 Tax=Sinomicrobium kalidii TaxID=2900738 RepID=UPI001E579E4A|nr:hypothetical protein [Sinomicrobium kalidii]UGU17337.1 hypothetical protein LS482_05560 [Sinomicrobium kalidii]